MSYMWALKCHVGLVTPLFKTVFAKNFCLNSSVRAICESPCQGPSDLDAFNEVFPVLVNDLVQRESHNPEVQDAVQWFKQVNEYNVPLGKKNRGLAVVQSYRFLVPDATAEDRRRAAVLGWCAEWFQSSFLVSDDIMDGSYTRRGQECWYRKTEVGLTAINDSFYLECAIYATLKLHFREQPCYLDILELFHETTLQTVIGQNLDLRTATGDLLRFTDATYRAIVKWKTSLYSFYLPVALAMYLAGVRDPSTHENAKGVLLKIGEFFQVQDDFLDCFGDPAVTGKVGTDIQDNKCSWLVVTALQGCDRLQRDTLRENYGHDDPVKVSRVKSVYDNLMLRQRYAKYERDSYSDLMRMIDKLQGELPRDMFINLAEKIYKRNK